jgi:hypothetical protein
VTSTSETVVAVVVTVGATAVLSPELPAHALTGVVLLIPM